MSDQTIITGGYAEPVGSPPIVPPSTPGSINGATINGYSFAGSGGGLVLSPIIPNATSIALPFSDTVELLGPSANYLNWGITPVGLGVPITIYSVGTSGVNVIVNTSGYTAGDLYQVSIPQGILGTTAGDSYPAPSSATFTAVGTGLAFSVIAKDARTLILNFNEPVMNDQALTPGNYMIDHGLFCTGVVQNTTLQFTLTTTQMVPGTVYTIVADVYSLNGN